MRNIHLKDTIKNIENLMDENYIILEEINKNKEVTYISDDVSKDDILQRFDTYDIKDIIFYNCSCVSDGIVTSVKYRVVIFYKTGDIDIFYDEGKLYLNKEIIERDFLLKNDIIDTEFEIEKGTYLLINKII